MESPPIVTPDQWGARAPKSRPIAAGQPERIIFHHTAGHHREIAGPRNESLEESKRYARDIQSFHMDERGWNDSGHNFLVCRNGVVLVGRWGSLLAIKRGLMIVSAHCPGQNTQPGIEHEHNGDEPMTRAQSDASALLHAWIMHSCQMRGGVWAVIRSHREFFATACPGALARELPEFRLRVNRYLGK